MWARMMSRLVLFVLICTVVFTLATQDSETSEMRRLTAFVVAGSIFLLIGIIALIIILLAEPNCQTASPNVSQHLATKTPYRVNAGGEEYVSSCPAKKIWILSRHGTRFPRDKDIIAMQKDLPLLQEKILASSGSLCGADVERLKGWKPNPLLNVSMESWLADEGHKELFGIGLRWKMRYPGLFPKEFTESHYNLRTTLKQRTIESGKSFAEAIFGNETSGYFPKPVKNDPLLEFYKICKKYIKEVDDNPAAEEEVKKFVGSEPYLETIARVKTLLGLEALSQAETKLMYTTCTFETAWTPESVSPWCSVFGEEDLGVLEYEEDLEEFYESSYAFPINYAQACPLLQDLEEKFSTEQGPAVTAYFAHSGTIAKLYALLGLFKDPVKLTSDTFSSLKHDRKWRSSVIGKFASNIAFLLLNCPEAEGGETIEMYVQEKLQSLPVCGSVKCRYEEFKQYYAGIIDTCDFNKICEN